MRVCLLIILLISTYSCKSGEVLNRPIEPQCIGNGDGTAECAIKRTDTEIEEYTATDTTNYVMSPIDSFQRMQKYVLRIEKENIQLRRKLDKAVGKIKKYRKKRKLKYLDLPEGFFKFTPE